MAIAIRGIRVKALSISRDSDTGKEKVSGDYELISTDDKVLAKQGFNGYSDIAVAWSSDTQKALTAFLASVKGDINSVLGLTEA